MMHTRAKFSRLLSTVVLLSVVPLAAANDSWEVLENGLLESGRLESDSVVERARMPETYHGLSGHDDGGDDEQVVAVDGSESNTENTMPRARQRAKHYPMSSPHGADEDEQELWQEGRVPDQSHPLGSRENRGDEEHQDDLDAFEGYEENEEEWGEDHGDEEHQDDLDAFEGYEENEEEWAGDPGDQEDAYRSRYHLPYSTDNRIDYDPNGDDQQDEAFYDDDAGYYQ